MIYIQNNKYQNRQALKKQTWKVSIKSTMEDKPGFKVNGFFSIYSDLSSMPSSLGRFGNEEWKLFEQMTDAWNIFKTLF